MSFDLDAYKKALLSWEGGLKDIDILNDLGGETNGGITESSWETFQIYYVNLRDTALADITYSDWSLFVNWYCDYWKVSIIKVPELCWYIFDIVWGSGKFGIIQVQKSLGVQPTGFFDDTTMIALTSIPNMADFLISSSAQMEKYYYAIVDNNATQKIFLNGWLNRNQDRYDFFEPFFLRARYPGRKQRSSRKRIIV